MSVCAIVSTLGIDQEVFAKLAEMDMTVADLERANMRVATVERRNVRDSPLLICCFHR